jgi:alanyl-tRNA synthetase
MIKTRHELIQKYVDFFKSKKHHNLPSASLFPENDPTVLFTTAGNASIGSVFARGEASAWGEVGERAEVCADWGH